MDDVFYQRMGSRIREQREKKGLTQGELAEKLSLSRTSLTSIETGKQRVLVDQLDRIATALDVPVTKLWPKTTEIQTPKPGLPEIVVQWQRKRSDAA
ncbi:helix-turn-helix domain-containing protein [Roseiterribacter gracilis]